MNRIRITNLLLTSIIGVIVFGCQQSEDLEMTVKDIDGQVYQTTRFGNEIWMKENLNVVRYRNGDSIPEVKDVNQWKSLKTGAWCYLYNSHEPINAFSSRLNSKLYNCYAINDPRGLAPEGWAIPPRQSWDSLNSFFINDPGSQKLISFGIQSDGYRNADGTWGVSGYTLYYWANDNSYINFQFIRGEGFGIKTFDMEKEEEKNMGYAVRCIKQK